MSSYAVRNSFSARLRVEGVHAAVAMAAVVATFYSAMALEHAFRLGVGVLVLAVALSLTAARTERTASRRRRLAGLVTMPVLAVVAGGVGELMVHLPTVGKAVFTLALSGPIWLRRFGPVAARAGAWVAMPFIAVLVTPVPGPVGAWTVLWSAPIAVLAWGWVALLQTAARYLGLLDTTPPPRPAPEPRRRDAPRKAGWRGLSASTRMAVQMGLSLAAAFLVGGLLFGRHWPWLVITAYVVSAGNRGRGDVLHKAALRFAGASAGTIAVTVLASFLPRHATADVVAIFVLLGIGTALRQFTYAYWAGCVTGVLALLYSYFGETGGTELLGVRLAAIATGAVLAAAAHWFVLPVRSADVFRKRLGAVLAALADLLRAVRHEPERCAEHGARFASDLALLEQVARTAELHRMLLRRRARTARAAHPADAVDALRTLAEPVRVLAAPAADGSGATAGPHHLRLRAAVASNVTELRRALGHRPGDGHRPLPPAPPGGEDPASAALRAVGTAVERMAEVFPSVEAGAAVDASVNTAVDTAESHAPGTRARAT
ncbi:FUSC family protein [Streptomyces sp. WZ-12]|uniref:FUSC family protein n=1 Tax=Streptomyces sp. WZ-12 TaxID=3030210 RepID=UPI002381648E|nr:FUSC family protein [Streptomyces sp. WZ-12]